MRRALTILAVLGAVAAVWMFLSSLDPAGSPESEQPESMTTVAGTSVGGGNEDGRPRAAVRPSDRLVTLRVRVVDADGTPCGGVRVGFYLPMAVDGGDTEAGTGEFESKVRFGDWPAGSEPWPDSPGSVDVTLPIRGLVSPPMVFRGPYPLVRRGELEYEAEVRLPPTVSIACNVFDEDGTPLSGEHAVSIAMWPAPTWESTRPIVDGHVEFPWVQPGVEFRITVYAHEYEFPPVRLRVRGPATPGERRDLKITISRRRPVITGILVDETGNPAAELELDIAHLVAAGEPWAGAHGYDFHTDERGRFRFELDSPPGPSRGAWIRLTHEPGTRDASTVTFPLPTSLEAGENDVGTLVLPVRERPLLLSGVVVDEQGKPVEGVFASSAEPREQSDAGLAWTDADGRFELRGTDADGLVSAEFEEEGFATAWPPPFAAGTRDARVVLRRGAGVAGSVRLPLGTHPSHFRVRLEHESGRVFTMAIEEDGSFGMRVPPGKARVTIELRDFPDEPVLVADSVELVAGRTTRDPRLQDIRLADFVKVMTVFVGDAQGRRILLAAVHWRPSGSGGAWHEDLAGTDGTEVIVVREGSLDLVAFAEGYGRSRAEGVDADHRFALAPIEPFMLDVRLPAGVRPPPPSHCLTPRVTWLGTQVADADTAGGARYDLLAYAQGWIDGVARLRLWDRGRYRLQLFVSEREDTWFDRGGGKPVGEAVDFELPADATTFAIDARVTQQQIDEARK